MPPCASKPCGRYRADVGEPLSRDGSQLPESDRECSFCSLEASVRTSLGSPVVEDPRVLPANCATHPQWSLGATFGGIGDGKTKAGCRRRAAGFADGRAFRRDRVARAAASDTCDWHGQEIGGEPKGKSYPGALTEGTRHQRGKGNGPEHRSTGENSWRPAGSDACLNQTSRAREGLSDGSHRCVIAPSESEAP